MKNCSIFLLLVLVTLFTCGFDWGFGAKDKCGDAKRLVTELAMVKTAAERTAMEARILRLCPEGGAGHYIKAINLEKAGNIDGASIEYGEALKDDPTFPQASGNLGLIHLQQGLYDEAAVELTVALKTVPTPATTGGWPASSASASSTRWRSTITTKWP
jgi:tetratricopeptide (TPR) repeat protein